MNNRHGVGLENLVVFGVLVTGSVNPRIFSIRSRTMHLRNCYLSHSHSSTKFILITLRETTQTNSIYPNSFISLCLTTMCQQNYDWSHPPSFPTLGTGTTRVRSSLGCRRTKHSCVCPPPSPPPVRDTDYATRMNLQLPPYCHSSGCRGLNLTMAFEQFMARITVCVHDLKFRQPSDRVPSPNTTSHAKSTAQALTGNCISSYTPTCACMLIMCRL